MEKIPLLCLPALFLFAASATADITWTGAINGNWSVAGNWSPAQVPGPLDQAIINSGSVTVDVPATVGGLTLTGGNFLGPEALTVSTQLNWSGGSLDRAAQLTLLPAGSGTLSGAGAKQIFGNSTFNNQGALTWTDAGTIYVYSGAFNNSGLLEARNDARIIDEDSGTVGAFNNTGTLRKAGSTGTTTIGPIIRVNNDGLIVAQSGTISLIANSTSSGAFESTSPGMVVFNVATHTLNAGARLIGSGTNRLAGGTLKLAGSAGAERFELVGGVVEGPETLTVTNQLNWSGGYLTAAAVLTLLPQGSGTLSGAGSKQLLGNSTLNNRGTLTWTDEGNIYVYSGAFNNSGLLEAHNDAGIIDLDSGTFGGFDNTGTLRKTASTGTTTIGPIIFTNSNTLDIRTGTISIVGNYAPGAASTHRFAIGGTTAGTNFGVLKASGTITLDGQLDLLLADNFTPTPADTFAILAGGSRSGTFASVAGRDAGNGFYFNPTYPAKGVTVVVANGQPSFNAGLSPLVNGQFHIWLGGVAGASYRIDASTNLTAWNPISTNVIPGSAILDFIDADSQNLPHRFYRAKFLP